MGSPGSNDHHGRGSGRRTRAFVASVAGAALVASTFVVVAVPTPAGAASLTVNSVGDSPDAVPGDGTCETATPGECTLRAAIEEANALAGADLIGFAIPGAGVHTIQPATPLPTVDDDVTIDGSTQPGSSANTLAVGSDATINVRLDGTTVGFGSGLVLNAPATVRGLAITGFPASGIIVGFSTALEGNFIGIAPDGITDAGNGSYGVLVNGGGASVFGGTGRASRNVISGNADDGIYITGTATDNVVTGNVIGADRTGSIAVANLSGVCACSFGSSGNHLVEDNLLSGNAAAGVYSVGDSTVIVGNLIGTDGSGLVALPNNWGVVADIPSTNLQIGDGTVGGRNVISGNLGQGVWLVQATDAEIVGNVIGVGVDESTPIANALGILVSASGTTGAHIGGTTLGAGNIIAHNSGAGVRLADGVGTRVQGNAIHDNGGPGILLGAGPTNAPNDVDDADSGPNNLQNTPEIISADLAPDLQIAVSIDSAPGNATAPIEIDFYEADSAANGQGERYIGSATLPVTPGGQTLSLGTLTGVTAGDSIVATATDADGNTSPFSAPVSLPAYEVDSTGDAGDATPGDGICETATPGECTLRAAIQESNAHAGSDAITFAIPGAGVQTIAPLSPLPQLTDTVTIDGYTQPGASANTLAVGSDAVLLIELTGQGNVGAFTNRIGLDVAADDVVVRGLVINGHDRPGFSPDTGASIRIVAGASRAVIEGNFLGTNAAGTAKATPTSIFGVNVFGDDAVIGGTAPAQRNVALGVLGGVSVENGGSATIIGNYLGTDKTGTVGLAGGGGSANGVSLSASATATVGGTTPGSGNVISGNDYGIQVNGAAAGFPKVVLGNFIGTNATGNAKPSGQNDIYGVFVGSFVSGGSVQIGDGTSQGRNVITGDRGITTLGPRIDVRGNSIGVGADGIAALPILASGVFLQGGSTSVVGGLGVGDGNVIANARYGVQLLLGAQRHTIVGNSMYANADNGIFLTVFGLVNDAGDPDAGANNLQNHPTVAPTIVGGDLVVDYTIDSTVVNSAYPIAIDVYVADDALGRSGQVYLGRATAAGPGAGNANLGNLTGAVAGQTIVATATDANGNTSQFSTPVVIPGPAAPTISLDLMVSAGSPTTVDIAPDGIRVTDIDRGALGGAGGAGSVAASSISAIGPEDTALAAITIGATPLRAIVLDSTPLRAIPLVEIEVNQDGGGGWTALLDGTDLENVPLTNLTFGDALSNSTVSDRIAALPLRAIDVAGTPLRAIPIAAIALGSTPLRAIPLRAIGPGEPNPWCDIIASLLQPGQSCESALDELNLMEVTLRGVPLRAIPLRAIPLRAIDIQTTPLRAIPLRAIDLGISPLRAIPLRAIDLEASPLRAIPLRAIPLRAIPLRAIDLGTTPLRAIDVDSTPLRAIEVEGLSIDGTPLRAIPLRAIPLRAIDLEASPLRAIPLRAIPLRAIPLRAIDLESTPLRAIPLRAIDVQGSPLASIPLRAIDLQTSPLRAIPLRAIPLRAIPLRAIPLRAIDVEGTPLRAIPLRAIDVLGSPLRAIPLRAITSVGTIDCQRVDCATGTLGDAIEAGAVSSTATLGDILEAAEGIRLGDIAGSFDDVTAEELTAAIEASDHTLGELTTLDDLTLGDLPTDRAEFDLVTLNDLGAALSTVTVGDLIGRAINPGTNAPYTAGELGAEVQNWSATVGQLDETGPLTMGDLLDAYNGQVHLDDLGSLLDFITVDQLTTIVGPALRSQIDGMSEELGDLTDAQLGRMTLLDLGTTIGDITVEELLAGLGAALDEYTLGDLLMAMVDPGSLAYGGAEFDGFDEKSLPAGTIGATRFSASFTLTAATPQNVNVEVELPPSATYVPGSALVGGDASEPTQVGQTLVWSVVDPGGAPVEIEFDVLPALRLGATSLAATATVVGTDISATSSASITVAEGSEPNDFQLSGGPGSARQTTPAAEDVIYLTYVPTATDIDVFEIDLAENDRLVVQLSNLDADLDVVVWGRADDTVAAAALGPVGPEAPLPLVVDPDADGADATIADDFVRLDALDPTLRLVAASNTSGTRSETIDTDRLPAGTYFVQVYGANGATNVAPASLQLKVREGDAPPACRATGPLPAAVAVPSAPTIPASANTLVLFDPSRIEQLHGAAARADVTAAIGRLTAYLGANPQLGVVPVVVPVDAYPAVRSAYAAWDDAAGSCDPAAANAVVAAINTSIIDPRRGQFDHIVILGGDDLIPMARVDDGTVVANEYDFRDELDGQLAGGSGDAMNSVTAPFWESMIRSDEPYGDASARRSGDGYLYVSDVALGRVVETPAEIVEALDTFVQFGGSLSIETATVLGYDFLADGSEAVADELEASALPVDGALASGQNEAGTGPWTADDATTALQRAGTNAVVSLNAHFDYYRALPAVGDKVPGFDDNLIATEVEDTLGAGALAQSLVFSMGCHSGLSVSDVLIGSPNADWAQTLGRQGALFVGNTGFGYGDTQTVAYSEELMRLFADRVTAPFALPNGPSTSSSTIGQALTWAKNDFVAGRQVFSVYDAKAVMESTFYGLPFYRVGIQPAALPPAPTRTANPDGTGTSTSRVMVTADNSVVTTPSGSYPLNVDAAGNDLVIVAPGRPIQPRLVEDISVVDPAEPTSLAQVAHGAIVEDMSSTYTGVADPVIATPVFDSSASQPEPEVGDVAFPTTPLQITSSTGPSGERQQLVLATGQYRSDTDVQRLDSELDVVVYYADPAETDFAAPTIGAVDSQIVGGRLAISTTIADSSDVDRVYALVVENPGFGDAEWTGVDLVRSGSTDRWTGSLVLDPDTTEVEFILQAKDGAGNVGVATNKARNFDAVETPPPPAPPTQVLSAAPAASPGAQGIYGGPVEIVVTGTAANATNITAEYVVDGVRRGAVPASGRFSITGDGLHTWEVNVPSGYAIRGSVLIDSSAPVVVLDRAAGPVRADTPLSVTAGDAGAGVASITYSATGATTIAPTTVNAASVLLALTGTGTTTVTVTATDTIGNISAPVSATYTVDGSAPVVTATLSTPANAAGWHRQPFQIEWSTDDPDATVPAPTSVTVEGAAVVITSAPSCDPAGNCAVGTVTVSLDLVAPAATVATDQAPNSEDWNNTPVTARVTCAPDLSGAVCPDPVTVSVDGAGQTVSFSVVDTADNVTSLVSRVINIDRVPPVVTWNAPANGATVLQSAYVRPTCGVSDALSGTDGVCTVDLPEPDMTTPGRAVYVATAVGSDKAGNTTTLTSTYTVLTDEQGPLVDVTATPPANAAGWWRAPVTYSFVCTDPTGVASCPGPRTVSAQGSNQSFTVSASDGNGNATAVTVSAINIDLTQPVLTVSAPASVGPLDTVTITCSASDPLSGIESSSCVDRTFPASTLAPGPNTFTFTATDVAGNVATTTRVIDLVVPVNAAPTVRADMGVTGLNEIGFQTNIVVISGTFSDPGGPGPFTASVRWTAGGSYTSLVINNSSEFVAAFIYGSAGTRTVTVRICDAGGSCGTDDIVVRTKVTQKVVPVLDCVRDRGAAMSPRYQATWGYRNPAPYAIAVASLPLLENTFTSAPYLRGQPQIFMPGTRTNAFSTTFQSGTSSWRLNGVTASATSGSRRC